MPVDRGRFNTPMLFFRIDPQEPLRSTIPKNTSPVSTCTACIPVIIKKTAEPALAEGVTPAAIALGHLHPEDADHENEPEHECCHNAGDEAAPIAMLHGDRRGFVTGIVATLVLGLIFVAGVLGVEWPSADNSGGRTPSASAGSAVFFMMTGMHAVHVLTGLVFLGIVLRKGLLGIYTEEKHWGVEAAAVYWHFVNQCRSLLPCAIPDRQVALTEIDVRGPSCIGCPTDPGWSTLCKREWYGWEFHDRIAVVALMAAAWLITNKPSLQGTVTPPVRQLKSDCKTQIARISR